MLPISSVFLAALRGTPRQNLRVHPRRVCALLDGDSGNRRLAPDCGAPNQMGRGGVLSVQGVAVALSGGNEWGHLVMGRVERAGAGRVQELIRPEASRRQRRQRRVVAVVAGGVLALCLAGCAPGPARHRDPSTLGTSHAVRTTQPVPVAGPPSGHLAGSLVDLGQARPGQKVVALTFDDGPGPYTRRILRILVRHRAPATFFEIGDQVAAFPHVPAALARSGMNVQSHTWDHADLARLSTSQVRAQVDRAAAAITSATGHRPSCLRPPYNAFDPAVLRQLSGAGIQAMSYDVDSQDWQRPGSERIVDNIMAQVAPGSVILMHDGGGDRSQTVAALPHVIHRLRTAGYTLVPLACPGQPIP